MYPLLSRPWLRSAAAGALVWIGLVAAPIDPAYGIGTIEVLFLLAPLVVAPLGFELIEGATGRLFALSRARVLMQAIAAFLAVASYFFPPGPVAGLLAAPWGVVTVAAGVSGLAALRGGAWRRSESLCFVAPLLTLPVGGVGLLQSRLGIAALGYGEPLLLLVAVHFHYAAFVSPLLAGAVIRQFGEAPPLLRRAFGLLALCVCVGSPVLAAGYVLFVPLLRVVGAGLLVSGLGVVSLLTLAALPSVRGWWSRTLLAGASLCLPAAMLYAAVYAVADFFGRVWIAIPHMARTHGVVNALGAGVCGLLGWAIASGGVSTTSERRE